MKKDVLILLSTYNGEKYIIEQLNSLILQLDVEFDCIIRDDGSQDNTLNLLEEFCKKNHHSFSFITGNNLGCVKSFFSLLAYADDIADNYNYFAFCDQDDFWMEKKIISAINKLELNFRNPVISEKPYLYCSGLHIVDSSLKSMGMMTHNWVNISKESALVFNKATGCTCMFNRAALKYSLMAHKLDDIPMHDYWIYLICVYFGSVVYDEESYILYRQHGNNIIGANKKSLKRRIKGFIMTLKSYNDHFRQDMVKNFLSSFSFLIKEEDVKIMQLIITYRTNFRNKISLIFNKKIKSNSITKNLRLILRIIFNSI